MSHRDSLVTASGYIGRYLVNLSNLSLVLATNDDHCVAASYMHIVADGLLVVVQLVVLPSLSRALHESPHN